MRNGRWGPILDNIELRLLCTQTETSELKVEGEQQDSQKWDMLEACHNAHQTD